MDILDHLIRFAQLTGSINVQCLFQGNWQLEHKKHHNQGIVHIVTKGSGFVKIDKQAARQIKTGDIIFLPQSDAHILTSSFDPMLPKQMIITSQQGALTYKRTGETQTEFSLFCATFEYDSQAEIISNLPTALFLHIEYSEIQPLLALLSTESHSEQQASQSVINALATVLFVKLIRCYLNNEQAQLSGTLNGWQDRRLRKLIQQVVKKPEENWTVENMLIITNLSRAQLMRLFKQKTNLTPHAFVTKMRLQKAAMLLNQRPDSILNIALATGFQSETHFGKAFKKLYGITPNVYRKKKFQS